MSNISQYNHSDNPSPLITKLLWRQQQELVTKFPPGVKIIINEEDPLDISAIIEGPLGTPYEGGIFKVKIVVSSEFPSVAPKGYFMTKIFHPNVSEKGEICVNTLKRDWNPKQWSLYHVLEVIKCLLIVPFPESSLNEEAGKLFMEDYEKYFKIASIFTSVHAITKDTSNSSNKYINNILVNDQSNPSNSKNELYKLKQNHTNILQIQNKNLSQKNEDNYFSNNPNTNNFFELTGNNEVDSCQITGGFKTPTNTNTNNNLNSNYSNESNFDFHLLRQSRSVCVKPTQHGKFIDTNIKQLHNRKDSNIEMLNENRSCQKLNISSLPFIARSNSFAICNAENQNTLNFLQFNNSGLANFTHSGSTVNNNFSLIQRDSNQNNINMSNFNNTSKSKKDEIKKWLSRI